MKRISGRSSDELRPLSIEYQPFGYADASVLVSLGGTKVLCSVTMQRSVPPFLKGKKVGWLNAEYAMLPTATKQRTNRSTSSVKQPGRSVEISRLIGRCLRTVVDVSSIGERTIIIDCDVLQADGGTRTAALTGASIALQKAQERWLADKTISCPILTETLAAISVGMRDGQPLLDVDFAEDCALDVDYNFVLTASGTIIEIQGTAEKAPLSWQQFEQMAALARSGVQRLLASIADDMHDQGTSSVHETKASLFSIKNRLQDTTN